MSIKITFLVFILKIATVHLQNSTNNDFWWQQLGSKISQNTRRLETLDQEHKLIWSKISNSLKILDAKLENLSQSKAIVEKTIPQNCLELKNLGYNKSDIYLIQPKFAPRPLLVKCEMQSKGGGWTYFLNRFDGSTDFNLKWKSYKVGFGNIGGEFWLGLDNLHYLTGYEVVELLVEFAESDNNTLYAHYKYFSIGSESEEYAMKLLSGFNGNVENRLSYHVGQKFSTKDRDQDLSPTENCADKYTGGWWYNYCHFTHFTGTFGDSSTKGVSWLHNKPLKYGKMLIRPQQ